MVDDEFRNWVNAQKPETRETAKTIRDNINSDEFWTMVKAALQVTEPIFSLLRLCDGKWLEAGMCLRSCSARSSHALCFARDPPPAGVTPVLSKVYMRLLAYDILLKDEDVDGLSEDIRVSMHKLFMARWDYLHHDVYTAAAMVDPEHAERVWDSDEQSALSTIFSKLEMTPGAEAAGVTAAQARLEWSRWRRAFTTTGEYGMTDDVRAQAKKLPAWEWWDAFGGFFPALQWCARRLCAQGCAACACERNWSAYEFIHSEKRNRLAPERAEKLVSIFSNLQLLRRFQDFINGHVEWDDEMAVELSAEEEAALREQLEPEEQLLLEVDEAEEVQMVTRSGFSPNRGRGPSRVSEQPLQPAGHAAGASTGGSRAQQQPQRQQRMVQLRFTTTAAPN